MEDIKKEVKVKRVENFKLLTAPLFRIGVRSIIAIAAIIWTGWFLSEATFAPPEKISVVGKLIVGFITGSVVSVIINFYFGSSQKTEDKSIEKDKQ